MRLSLKVNGVIMRNFDVFFYVRTTISLNFHICISVPLNLSIILLWIFLFIESMDLVLSIILYLTQRNQLSFFVMLLGLKTAFGWIYRGIFSHTAWKVSKYGVFSGPYFPLFGLNTEIYGVFGHFSQSYICSSFS